MKYNDRKAAQIAAYFLHKAGGVLPHMKLMKHMYLSDRESLKQYGFPISGDHFVSMDYGPVLSQTLNLINGAMASSEDGWERWISSRKNHDVKLIRKIKSRDSFDELSDVELAILKENWGQFGHLDQWDLSEYCHKNCHEWTDPKGSSLPISYAEALKAQGWKDRHAKEAANFAEAHNSLKRKLG